MEQKIFHGPAKPHDFARALQGQFNRGNLQVQQFGSGEHITVQIATHRYARAGGQTALTISMQQVEDGVSVQIGQQSWLGVAASLGITALAAFHNPFSLLQRLDHIAQDIEYVQLTDEVWRVIQETSKRMGLTYQLSNTLRKLVCPYCSVANPVGEPNCGACGAPLGLQQPTTCSRCGFAVRAGASYCPNCGNRITTS